MRCFVALTPGPAAVAALTAVIEDLQRAAAPVRWVTAERLHVTLKFLGEVDASRLARIGAALRAMPARGALHLGLDGLGGFPGGDRPRVLWAGLCGEVDRLIELAGEVDRRAGDAGIASETRPFRPHVTIGRVKAPAALGGLVERMRATELRTEPTPIDAVTLYHSELRRSGPVYTQLERYSLTP